MAAPVHRLWTPAGTGAKISNQECEWKQDESAVGEVRKGQTHFQEVKSVKVIGPPVGRRSISSVTRAPKTVLDDGGFLIEAFTICHLAPRSPPFPQKWLSYTGPPRGTAAVHFPRTPSFVHSELLPTWSAPLLSHGDKPVRVTISTLRDRETRQLRQGEPV